MRRPFIAGNWKMYKSSTEAEKLIHELLPLVKGASAEVAVCPAFTALDRARAALAGSSVALGAQNVYWQDEGAYTGEVAPGMLKDLGVKYVIVGHSERRQFFHETDETVNKRALAALGHGLLPILCVGERLEEREAGKTSLVVSTQIRGGFQKFSPEQAQKTVVAYEPVWAIGTGKVATPEQAQQVHAVIRSLLSELFGVSVAGEIRIQYGGSVKPDNAASLLSLPDVDGALVGGASLKADTFAAIVNAAPRRS